MAYQSLGVPVSVLATQVYVPPAVGSPTATVANIGSSTAYIGGSAVTVNTGLALTPNQIIDFPAYTTGIWAVAAIGTTGTATSLSAAVAAGTNAIFIPAGSGYGAGTNLQIGTGSAAEVIAVTSLASGTAITLTTNTRWAHASGEAVAQVTSSAGTCLNIQAGTR